MRILLDTHVWLWLVASPRRIPDGIRDELVDAKNVLYLSAASAWEMAIKYRLGKLPLPEPPSSFIPPRLVRDCIEELPVTMAHASRVAELPDIHADPFDRLLVAQAEMDRCTLVTADSKIAAYDVDVLMAG